MAKRPVLTLRSLRSGDAELMYAWRQERTINRFNPLDNITPQELGMRLASETGDLSDKGRNQFRWMVEHDDTPVGSVAVSGIAWRMGYGEIGYLLAEAHHGQGLGAAAVRLLVDKLFTETTLERLTATVSTENTPSWRLLERLGFKREGTLRQHYVVQGRRIDEFFYGFLRSEWSGPASSA